MSILKLFSSINLQLFADGGTGSGDSGTGAEGTTGVGASVPDLQSKTAEKNPLASVKYGKQEDDKPQIANEEKKAIEEPKVDRNAEFEKLIKGEYKDLYNQKVQDTIQKRLKGAKETEEKYNSLTPIMEILAKKYGVDATDIKALNQAIEDDDSYFEEEALEKGLTVKQLKSIRKMEKENAELKKQMREQAVRENADRLYASWLNQAEGIKSIYPSFNLNEEMQNPKFTDLIRNNVDIRTAYEVLHKDEIIPAAMQFTANKVEKQITNKIIANGVRPTENGINSSSSSVVKSDVSQLTKEDRAEIFRRVQRGEKIRF